MANLYHNAMKVLKNNNPSRHRSIIFLEKTNVEMLSYFYFQHTI